MNAPKLTTRGIVRLENKNPPPDKMTVQGVFVIVVAAYVIVLVSDQANYAKFRFYLQKLI